MSTTVNLFFFTFLQEKKTGNDNSWNFRPQTSPLAPAANAATAQPTSTARTISTQPNSQAVMQNPMEGRSVLEQRNNDENAEQEKVGELTDLQLEYLKNSFLCFSSPVPVNGL